MPPFPRPFLNRRATAAAALLVLACATPLRAEVTLLFSDKEDDKNPRPIPLLRPNVTQKLFVYVKNDGAAPEPVTVEVQAGGAVLEGGSSSSTVPANSTVRIELGKPLKPGEKAPPPSPAPPPLTEVKGRLKIVLTDKAKKSQPVTLDLANPVEYVRVDDDKIAFDPEPKDGAANRLTVEVTALEKFTGPPCRVELVLRPDRIPGLVADQKMVGTYSDFLKGPGTTVTLTAENLRFQPGTSFRSGLVYLRIDGYERAVTYEADFPEKGKPTRPGRKTGAILRLNSPAVANPAEPLPLSVEIDNTQNGVANLSLARGNKAVEEDRFAGNRKVKMLLDPAWPGGALTLKPEVADWSALLDVNGVFGARNLELTLTEGKKPATFVNSAALGDPVKAIVKTVVFDATGPEGIKFVDFPKTLAVGAALPVKLTASDPESQIKEVVFYVGKPGPDGKPPKEAELVPGKLVKDLWVAELTPATDKPGLLDVSARVTNGANLSANDTVKIQLVPAGAAAAVGKSSIQGVVYEGTRLATGLKQPDLVVTLVDDKGAIKDSVKSNKEGVFLFTDVAPGAYRVVAAKTGSMTKGATAVQVAPGEKKENVELKLVR